MFVYAFLILLPAAALADTCDKDVLNEFFRVLDTDKSRNVSKAEAYKLFEALDQNNDSKVTLAEAKSKAPSIAPTLVEHVAEIIRVLDFDRSGEITKSDIFLDFFFIDTNFDGFKDEKEWKRFVEKLCPFLFPTCTKLKCPGWAITYESH